MVIIAPGDNAAGQDALKALKLNEGYLDLLALVLKVEARRLLRLLLMELSQILRMLLMTLL